MKTIFKILTCCHFFVLPLLSSGQLCDLTFKHTDKKSILTINDSITSLFDYTTYHGEGQDFLFENGKIVKKNTNGVVGTYELNQLYVNGQVYRFHKPWFSKKTYLQEMGKDVKLLEFNVTSIDCIEYEEQTAFKSLGADLKQLLKEWSYYKQAWYVLYNDYGTKDDRFLDGLFVGMFLGNP